MSIKAEHLTYKYGDGTAFEQYDDRRTYRSDFPSGDLICPPCAGNRSRRLTTLPVEATADG